MAVRVLFEVQGDSSQLSYNCPQPLTQETISRTFPLPGNWHFRAKSPVSVASPFDEYVWQDFTGSGKVPSFNGTVHLKAFPVEVTAVAYAESDDLIVIPGHGPINNEDVQQRDNRPRRGSSETPVKETASAMSSRFSMAFATSAKAALEAVRKNVT